MYRKYNHKIGLLALCLIIFACTTNPFFEDKIKSYDKQNIKGNVVLQGEKNNAGIVVYLEEFEIFTKTDKNGDFKITIPPAYTQPGTGITGLFKIYYYVANYKLQQSTVFINRGEFVFGEAALTDEGVIRDRLILQKLLDIRTDVNPLKIKNNFTGMVKVEVFIRNRVDSVIVFTHLSKTKELSSIYLTSNDTVHLINKASNLVSVVIDTPRVWNMYVDWRIHGKPILPDNYKVIPFISVYQYEIPEKLLDYFNAGTIRFTKDFLSIPYRRKSGKLKVDFADN
jgi:hypothetical protein